jgi:hypothetical protein
VEQIDFGVYGVEEKGIPAVMPVLSMVAYIPCSFPVLTILAAHYLIIIIIILPEHTFGAERSELF